MTFSLHMFQTPYFSLLPSSLPPLYSSSVTFFGYHLHSAWKWKCYSLSCVQLCKPMDCSPQGFSLHEIFYARILERVAIFSSSRSSQPRDGTHISSVDRQILYLWATIFSSIKKKKITFAAISKYQLFPMPLLFGVACHTTAGTVATMANSKWSSSNQEVGGTCPCAFSIEKTQQRGKPSPFPVYLPSPFKDFYEGLVYYWKIRNDRGSNS